MPARQFPFRPHLDQLRNQAKDLLRDVRAEAPSALADAQLVLARSYGASSWPQLAAAVKAIDAISHDDLEALREVAAAHPDLARDRDRPRDGWHAPLANAADAAIRRVIGRCRRGLAAARARAHTAARRLPSDPPRAAW